MIREINPLLKNIADMSQKQTLKKWLPEKKPRNRKERMVIYDFDGTIFDSPDRERGESLYFESTGQMFPFGGWWGRPETLMPPIVPDKPGDEWFIQHTIDVLRKDLEDENTECILMTGRPFKIRKRVIEICENHDLKFVDYFFRGQPGSKGRDTLQIKSNFITEDLMHQGLKIIELHEDRPEHVSGFCDLGKRLKKEFGHLEKILIHDVTLRNIHQI